MRRIRKEPWAVVAMDIDGTLTRVRSSWEFVHKRLGTWDKAGEYRESFRKGLISFSQWADFDVSLWKGLPANLFEEIVGEIPLVRDLNPSLQKLRREGFALGTISACIPSLSQRLEGELGLDFAIADSFEIKNGHLLGITKVVTPKNKHLHLERVASSFSVPLSMTVAIGDNWLDARMLRTAGLGIAFNPEDNEVQEAARITIRGKGMKKVVEEVRKWKTARSAWKQNS